MRTFTALVFISFLLAVHAHICVWEPRQRGELSIDFPGDPSCYMVDGPPCGGSTPGNPLTTLKGGSQYTIEFQQNLNHWYPNNPGVIVADITSSPSNNTWQSFGQALNDYPARDMVTQTNFTISGTVPNFNCVGCVLRVRYISNNPYEGSNSNVFYQCSDINIKASN
eukprot:TRINITY_DN265_c0_g1_i7.p2 TRINITY_DN265_c0_g1~~TRINITY_DN265_c0_g1_i7.p2  ORF type:complete len:167 (+),score=44.94 TRINITY_DN265_c0_g1_i7:1054-1554(+)